MKKTELSTFKEQQREVAVKRLKALNVIPEAIDQFKNDGVVMLSDWVYAFHTTWGFLYQLNEEQKEIVRQFEEDYKGVVYLVIHSITDFGELYDLLYVSSSPDEWVLDEDDIKECYPISYCYNKDFPINSEFGHIEILPMRGGVIRTQ